MGIFRDPKCTRCSRLLAACVCGSRPSAAIKRKPPTAPKKK